ncbi:MAG: hypothetical protein ABEI78_00895 [Candidatus Nanohaloarchaea archaeon]
MTKKKIGQIKIYRRKYEKNKEGKDKEKDKQKTLEKPIWVQLFKGGDFSDTDIWAWIYFITPKSKYQTLSKRNFFQDWKKDKNARWKQKESKPPYKDYTLSKMYIARPAEKIEDIIENLEYKWMPDQKIYGVKIEKKDYIKWEKIRSKIIAKKM